MKLKSTSKALAKALSPIPDRAPILNGGFRAAMLSACIISAAWISLLMAGLFPANAAEPLCWDRTPNHPAPAQFDTFHGQSLDFRCTFIGFSSLPFEQSSNPPIPQSSNSPRLYYQTNGMASAWWDIPATVSTTVVTNCQPPITNYSLSAVFPPSADPGAERLTVFFGAPSNAYAAAQVRFRNSPGATPNVLPPPDTIEWLSQLSSATNELAVSLSSQMSQISQSATNYTDLATNSLSTSLAPTISNTVTKAYVESLGIESGISAATATNIANSATNFLTRAEAISGYTDFVFSNKIDGVILTNAKAEYYPSTSYWMLSVNDEYVSYLVASKDAVYLEFPQSGRYDVIATRHRITPTALSQLTNDVGYASTNYVDNALTNRPTKAEMDAGWWSGWTFSDVMQGVSDITVAETTVGGDPALVFRFKYGNEIWLAYAGLDISTLTAMGGYDGLPSGTLFTATRHRVAAPVPTKISDLANDVGYVTASITNGLASTNYVDSSTNDLLSSACDYTDTATNSISISLMADLASATNALAGSQSSQMSHVSQASTNYTDSATNSLSTSFAHTIATADTTYRRTIGITNLNQTVQYVSVTDTSPTTLAIAMPTNGVTKDWIVYVSAVTNVTLSLPSVTWWMADAAYTNEVPPATPTAFYFSQITTNIFYLGRQELTEVAP